MLPFSMCCPWSEVNGRTIVFRTTSSWFVLSGGMRAGLTHQYRGHSTVNRSMFLQGRAAAHEKRDSSGVSNLHQGFSQAATRANRRPKS